MLPAIFGRGLWHAWLALQFLYCPSSDECHLAGGAFDREIRAGELRIILPRSHGGRNHLFPLDRTGLRELLCGSTRFNDLRRGVPRMSPTLLSKRLQAPQEAGVIVAKPAAQRGVVEYKLTEAGEELRGVIMSLGIWGQRWV